MINLKRKLSILIFYALSVLAQNAHGQNCFDSDFESGTVGGYVTYHGMIDNEGVVSFPNQVQSNDQHHIMEVIDGFDPIANQFCELNKNLLVAGSGTGKYTLRLGDVANGAQAAKVVLTFEVTEDVSFFLLKYAIVLNDPGHIVDVQPRFELSIKDGEGNILDCGEYKVRAEANIEGFESCEKWRVRPWTTAGFELASYIGQTINIEIISTDCGLGGHGGYAYIDATCTPLELELKSFCPDNGFARYVVTEGFDSYQWNTGETSRILDIDNAMPGVEYQVTVTSATGCTLVLRDTLPEFPSLENLEPSYFDSADSITVCFGEEIFYKPTGTNIDEVYAIELGYSATEFNIFADESRVINFVTADNFGCSYDTTQLFVTVEYLELDVEVISTCSGAAEGEIIINNTSVPVLLTSLQNDEFQNIYHYTGLMAGEYVLSFKNGSLCTFSKNIVIVEKEIPELDDLIIKPATCNLDNGTISAFSNNDIYQYSINDQPFTTNSEFSGLSSGAYVLSFREGEDGCVEEETIIIDAFDPPRLTVQVIDSTSCGKDNGRVILSTVGGFGQLQYSANGGGFKTNPTFDDLAANDYEFIVRDADNCRDTIYGSVFARAYLSMEQVVRTPATCGENNGSIDISLNTTDIPYQIFLDSIECKDLFIDSLANGLYSVYLIDDYGCQDSSLAFINYFAPPILDSISFQQHPCGSSEVEIAIYGRTYNDSITYSVYDDLFSSKKIHSLSPDIYNISIKDDLGCIADTIISLIAEDDFKMPNIFSPDEDGINDLFCVPHIDEIDFIISFEIFDRWGNKVFVFREAINSKSEICWDGKYGNIIVNPGVFVYSLHLKLKDGRELCKYGDVTVVR